jgi:hypothetical protein
MTRRMPNAPRTGPAPWKPLTSLSGPTTLPIAFDTGPALKRDVTTIRDSWRDAASKTSRYGC